MACVARAARGSFVTNLQFLLIRNAAEELNKFHYNYVYFYFMFSFAGRRDSDPYNIDINLYNKLHTYILHYTYLLKINFNKRRIIISPNKILILNNFK